MASINESGYIFANNIYRIGFGTMEIADSDRVLWGHTDDIFGYASIMIYIHTPAEKISIAVLANQGVDESVKIAIAKALLDTALEAE